MDTNIESRPKVVLRDIILKSCRVCMAQNPEMNCVFEPAKDNLCDKILYCTGLILSKADGLPTKVCNKCLEDLTIAHKFKSSCLIADETFRRVLQNNIKKETDLCDDLDSYQAFDDDGIAKEDVCDDNKVEIQAMLQNIENVTRTINNEVTKGKSKATEKPMSKKRGPYKKTRTRIAVQDNTVRAYNKDVISKRPKKYTFMKLTCVPCKVKFKTKIEFERHKADCHPMEIDSFVCEFCGKVFTSRASHYSHVRSHLPPMFSCAQCDYSTGYKHDLVKHIRIHTGTKPYQCEFCPRAYYTSSNLAGHIRQSHQLERKHHCAICPKAFFDRTKLNRHMDSHNDIKRYQCEVCQSGFTRRCYWKKHLERQHSIVIPPQRPGRQKMNAIVGEDSRKPELNDQMLLN